MLIVAVHCRMAFPWPEGSVIHEVLYHGLNASTILFVFISGFLFTHLCREGFRFKNYLLQKVKFVVVPYVLVSIPALLDKLIFEKEAAWMDSTYQQAGIVYKVLYMLVTGKHSGPFYFIPTIFLIYLLAPLFYRLLQSKYVDSIAALLVFAGLFSHHYGYYATLSESVVYFVPVYILGMWVSARKDQVLNWTNGVWLGVAGLYLTLFCLEVLQILPAYRLNGFGDVQLWQPFFNWGKLKEMTLALLLTGLFYRLKSRTFPALEFLGNFSFGIYFIHIYFINATEKVVDHFYGNRPQNLWLFLLFTAVVLAVSTGTIYLIKKITGKYSRWLTGS